VHLGKNKPGQSGTLALFLPVTAEINSRHLMLNGGHILNHDELKK
jgi:hypothetical protein